MTIGYRSISALKAIRLSDRTRSQLGDSYAQLSSGVRINRPSTDPGGLAVSLSLNTESKVTKRARLNAEDGISLASYAEAAFGSAVDIVQRMNELANQAANGILKSDQRNALNTEFASLREELYRIQKSSTFNGRAINYGSVTTANAKDIGAFTTESAFDTSADGRLVFFIEGGILKMRDMQSDSVTTLVSGLDGSTSISVSAAGDKIAYHKDENSSVYVYDRLTGVSSLAFSSVGTLHSMEMSGDGSVLAILATSVYDSSSTPDSTDTAHHLAVYDLTTGGVRGDTGAYGFNPTDYGISMSYNGDYVAVQGEELYSFGFSAEIYVYDTSDLTAALWTTSSGDRMENEFALDNSGNLYTADGGDLYKYTSSVNSSVNKVLSASQGFLKFLGLADGGNTVAFTSTGNQTGDNRNGLEQIFKYDLTSGAFRQISDYAAGAVLTNIRLISDDGFSVITNNNGRYYSHDLSPVMKVNISTGSGISGQVGISIVSLDGAARGLRGYSIATTSEAKSVASALTRSLEGLELGRATVGAASSRLGSASRALATKGTEQQAAYARITDVDTAESVAKLVRMQVLSQAQTAMIAQSSKLVPETALKLIQAA